MDADQIEQGEDPPRLTRTMSSRKLLALDFIKRYFARWGHSPTLGELAADLGVSTKRAYDLVHQLSDERMIEITSGKTRGIRLVDRTEELSEADLLVRLAALGFTIGVGDRVVQPPAVELDHVADALIGQLTEKGLPRPVDLDHDPPPMDAHPDQPGHLRTTGAGNHGRRRASGAEGRGRGAPEEGSRAANG